MNVALDIQDLEDQLDAAERDARALVGDLSEWQGEWHAETGSWSVAQCLDHLATTNRVYLDGMKEPAIRAREKGKFRRSPATPGLVGRWFVRTLEPPVKAPFRMKSPRIIEPRVSLSLANAFASFATTQDDVREFLRTYAGLDLAGFDSRTHLYAASASAWPLDYMSSPLTRGDTCGRLGACVGPRRVQLRDFPELKIQ